MITPYTNKILFVNYQGSNTPGNSVAELAGLLRRKVPNVAGIMLKTSNGVSWQGHVGNDDDPKAITGVTRIQEWVTALGSQGLDVHVWGVPRAKRANGANRSLDLPKEAEKFILAANVPGVKSLLLDVESGPFYWLGRPDEVQELMTLIRNGVTNNTHIGLILDGRNNRPFSFWVDPWIPFVDSLHPMVYPILFGNFQTIERHLDVAFQNLAPYSKPIIPMLQSFADGTRPTPAEITRQGKSAWARGADGISFFRVGKDLWGGDRQPHMGEAEYTAVAAIPLPVVPFQPPSYTWQDVINASVTTDLRNRGDWEQWWEEAGVWRVFNNALRRQPYSGPPIAQWPLASELRQQILDLLRLDPAELARITAEAQNQAEHTTPQRPSIIGIHGAPGVAAPPPQTWDTWIHYLKEMGIRWYKQCDNGDPNDTGPASIFAWVKRLKREGIEPIIRYLMSEQFPDPLPHTYFDKMRLYANEGILWAEIGNEPNLDIEWKSPWHNQPQNAPMHHGNPEVIRIIAETWVQDAQRALNAGVKPAFYAFAPTDWRGDSHHLYSSVFFTQKVVAYLARHCRSETVDIFRRGGWIAVHAATYEQPDDFNPFPPGQPVWDMILRSYEVVLRAFRDHFGADLDVGKLVVMSTEGGVFTPNSTSMTGHNRLGSDAEHAVRAVGMFRWLERNSPLQAMCPWCLSVGDLIGHFNAAFQHDGWIEEINGQLRPRAVYEAMRQLRFDREREQEATDPIHAMTKLAVPYISQFDDTASMHSADCGPACMAMILNANQSPSAQVTVDLLYTRHLPHKAPGEFTSIDEMLKIGQNEGVAMRRLDLTGNTALTQVRTLVEQRTPFVVLVNYARWDDIAQNNFAGGHFVVVTGFDEEHVFVHDPLFRGSRRAMGEFFTWKNQKFLAGWGEHDNGNPAFVAMVPDKQVTQL